MCQAPDACQRFKECKAAYDFLADERRRAEYDQCLALASRPPSPSGSIWTRGGGEHPGYSYQDACEYGLSSCSLSSMSMDDALCTFDTEEEEEFVEAVEPYLYWQVQQRRPPPPPLQQAAKAKPSGGHSLFWWQRR